MTKKNTPLDHSQLGVDLLLAAQSHVDSVPFLIEATHLLCDHLDLKYAAVAEPREGRWIVNAENSPGENLPTQLLGESLDTGEPQTAGPWSAVPLGSETQEILLLQPAGQDNTPGTSLTHEQLSFLANVLAAALKLPRTVQRHGRRIRRLEAILEIAASWNQQRETETLLVEMAETSTRLLDAERASIFLWDQTNGLLVGRPALGIEENELRIPDTAGVVGQVVHTGELRRVDQESGQSEIDRQVDQQLGFETRTVLCVPLRGSSGEILGAFEVLNKRAGNFTQDDTEGLTELAAHAGVALENTRELEQLTTSRHQIADEAAQRVQLIGNSPVMEALRSTIGRVANTDLAILILGENGTGKEVVSQMIHYMSSRHDEPFIAVNCAALTETLLESELFGHEKGAFTDAHDSRAGKFELASGGTLFLDEIGDLSLAGQAKLLRVLEEKVVVRVGGSQPIHTNARVLAATNQNLREMVAEKQFREDLFFRLNVVILQLPPLWERGDDVLLLAEHFLSDFSTKARRRRPRLSAAARKQLREHNWPGNIRELRNLMERLTYLAESETIEAHDLDFILPADQGKTGSIPLEMSLSDATNQFQVEYIERHIKTGTGNMSNVARRLDMHRSNLYRKMRQLGMHVEP